MEPQGSMPTDSDNEFKQLDRLAVHANTDKSSLFHNYMKVYAHYFSPYKDKPIKFLEIGIFHGDSVRLWEAYFKKAELHFIDITSTHIRYHSPRSHYHFLDQANPRDLQTFISQTGGEFDIIIDDGGHLMNQQITSFLFLFSALKKGGMYIIEDLHTSYWQQFGGGGDPKYPKPSPGSTIEFLKQLIDDVNYTAARTTCADDAKIPVEIRQKLNSFQEQILTLHFYTSLCVIIKKP